MNILKKIILTVVLMSTAAQGIESFYKGYVTERLEILKDKEGMFFIKNIDSITFKNNMIVTECIIPKLESLIDNDIKFEKTALVCTTENKGNIYIELKDLLMNEGFLILQDPYILGHSIDYEKIASQYN